MWILTFYIDFQKHRLTERSEANRLIKFQFFHNATKSFRIPNYSFQYGIYTNPSKILRAVRCVQTFVTRLLETDISGNIVITPLGWLNRTLPNIGISPISSRIVPVILQSTPTAHAAVNGEAL